MWRPFALAAVLVACAGPALAEADRPARACLDDPETTGALPADPRSLRLPGERPPEQVAVTPPEESWQDAEREDAERRRDLLACGVD